MLIRLIRIDRMIVLTRSPLFRNRSPCARITFKGSRSAYSQPPLGNNRFFVDFLSRGGGGEIGKGRNARLESGHKIRSIYGRNIFYWNRDTISRVWEIYPRNYTNRVKRSNPLLWVSVISSSRFYHRRLSFKSLHPKLCSDENWTNRR